MSEELLSLQKPNFFFTNVGQVTCGLLCSIVVVLQSIPTTHTVPVNEFCPCFHHTCASRTFYSLTVAG